jgi:hypothetical protein
MIDTDNVYGTWAGEPANEDNLSPEQELCYETIAPYGSENIEEEKHYDYSDGYER